MLLTGAGTKGCAPCVGESGDARACRMRAQDEVVVALDDDDERGGKHTLPVPPSPTRTSLKVGVDSAMVVIVVSKKRL